MILPANIIKIAQQMLFWNREYRIKHRYSVSWDGLLKVKFPDFQKHLTVKVIDFSSNGARLCSNRVFIGNYHLISKEYPPSLNLKINIPEYSFETPVEIKWYQWAYEKGCFEIGVKFVAMLQETRMITDKLITSLYNNRWEN